MAAELHVVNHNLKKYWWDGILKTTEGCSWCKLKINLLMRSSIAKCTVSQKLCGSIGGEKMTDLPLD